MGAKLPVMCPSARCEDGALLLGVVGPEGRASLLEEPLQVGAAFVAAAKQVGRPEQRFRFAQPCVQSGCSQWTGTRCGVIDQVLGDARRQGLPLDGPLPACALRNACRWFAQTGPAACAACPLVVTDSRQDPT